MPGYAEPANGWLAQKLSQLGEDIAILKALSAGGRDWAEPTLLNSWANQGGGRLTVAYRRQANVVRLRGSLFGGASASAAFVLPEGFRPTADAFASSGGYTTQVSPTGVVVKATGEVVLYFDSSATQAAIDGVTFTID